SAECPVINRRLVDQAGKIVREARMRRPSNEDRLGGRNSGSNDVCESEIFGAVDVQYQLAGGGIVSHCNVIPASRLNGCSPVSVAEAARCSDMRAKFLVP